MGENYITRLNMVKLFVIVLGGPDKHGIFDNDTATSTLHSDILYSIMTVVVIFFRVLL